MGGSVAVYGRLLADHLGRHTTAAFTRAVTLPPRIGAELGGYASDRTKDDEAAESGRLRG